MRLANAPCVAYTFAIQSHASLMALGAVGTDGIASLISSTVKQKRCVTSLTHGLWSISGHRRVHCDQEGWRQLAVTCCEIFRRRHKGTVTFFFHSHRAPRL